MIAKKLNYRTLDDQIIQEIAQHARVSKSAVISMERTAGGAISRLMSGLLSRDYMERLTGDDRGYMDEEVYVQTLFEVMRKLAEEDNVILIGRGGQYILENHEGAYHVLLVATREDRIAFMRDHYNLSESKAKSVVMDGEKRRTNLYRKFERQDYNDPLHYHLVLNMSRMSLELAADMVCALVGEQKA
jgi:cytidylate kinase